MKRLTKLPLPTVAFEPGAGRPTFEVPDGLDTTTAFALGADLYHAGCLWEAHEVWEGLWRGLPRDEPVARALRGLIQAAAAGLKARAGRRSGASSLAAKARGELAAAGARLELFGRELEAGRLAEDLAAWNAAGPPPTLRLA